MPSYLVTGAGRGLGYGFLTTLAADPANQVFGLVRDKQATQDKLAADNIDNVNLVVADITDDKALKAAASEVGTLLGGKGLDVLINNAAYVNWQTPTKELLDFEDDLETFIQDAQKSFDINYFGILKTVFAFLPLVRKGELKKVVAISSGMGDLDLINEIKLSNGAPYAASKAALNTLMAKFNAAESDNGILFVSICPGSIDSSEGVPPNFEEKDMPKVMNFMGKLNQYSPGFQFSTPKASARSVLDAIDRSSLEAGSGGTFFSQTGTKRYF